MEILHGRSRLDCYKPGVTATRETNLNPMNFAISLIGEDQDLHPGVADHPTPPVFSIGGFIGFIGSD